MVLFALTIVYLRLEQSISPESSHKTYNKFKKEDNEFVQDTN